MAAINKALADLESREPGEPFLYGKTAANYGVERSHAREKTPGLARNQKKLRINNNLSSRPTKKLSLYSI